VVLDEITVTTDAGSNQQQLAVLGQAIAGMEVRLRPSDDNAGIVGREVGEVEIRGTSMMSGYLGQEPLNPGDWFATGDLVVADGAGRLRLVGRTSCVINVSGMKCFPEEIEAVLREHPEVAAARVSGRVHGHVGAVPVADVVPRDPGQPPTASALAAHCRAGLARFKVPVAFRMVDSLPLTASGKLKR